MTFETMMRTDPHAATLLADSPCARCGHPFSEHGRESDFYECDGSRREVCLRCDGYEEPGYPNGEAWHRFEAVRA